MYKMKPTMSNILVFGSFLVAVCCLLTLFSDMPFSLRLALPSALLSLSLLPSALPFTPGFPYGSQKVRGVNLGGWLVLEVC